MREQAQEQDSFRRQRKNCSGADRRSETDSRDILPGLPSARPMRGAFSGSLPALNRNDDDFCPRPASISGGRFYSAESTLEHGFFFVPLSVESSCSAAFGRTFQRQLSVASCSRRPSGHILPVRNAPAAVPKVAIESFCCGTLPEFLRWLHFGARPSHRIEARAVRKYNEEISALRSSTLAA